MAMLSAEGGPWGAPFGSVTVAENDQADHASLKDKSPPIVPIFRINRGHYS
jgi:hypothetical protein